MVSPGAPGGPLRLVCFELRAQELALPIADVRETLPVPPITRVFLTPPCLAGVFSLRGDIVPVIDLGVLLGLPATAVGDDSKIVVVDYAAGVAGIVVDRLRDLRTVEPPLEPPPANLSGEIASLLARRGRDPDRQRARARRARGSHRRAAARAGAGRRGRQDAMTRRRLRFPMFFKFLVGCLALAALLIIGGTFVVRNETRLRSRGNYLQKQDRRLDGYLDRVGRDMTATLELLVSDDELRGRDEPGSPARRGPRRPGAGRPARPVARVQRRRPRPRPPSRPTARPPGSRPRSAMPARCTTRCRPESGLRPDVFALFTPANRLAFVAPARALDEQALPALAAVEKARGGSVFAHRVQVIDGVPYQMSALPIRGPRDQVVGGMLVGVKLERLFAEFADQSDDQVDTQIRPTLIDGTTILASAWPADRRAELARAMQPDRVVRVTLGDDTRDVIRLKDGDYDFYSDDNYEGYKADDSRAVGRLVITRSRATLVDPASKLPWMEIASAIAASVIIALGMGLLITRPIKQFVRQSRDLLAGRHRPHAAPGDQLARRDRRSRRQHQPGVRAAAPARDRRPVGGVPGRRVERRDQRGVAPDAVRAQGPDAQDRELDHRGDRAVGVDPAGRRQRRAGDRRRRAVDRPR